MDPETGQGGGAVHNQQPTAPAQGQPIQNHSAFKTAPKVSDDSFSQFKEHSAFNFPVAITWTMAVFSIVATLFFWWMNKNLTETLKEKDSEKATILQQIASQGDTEKKANDFKLSVNQLKAAYAEKYSLSTFNTELYKKITNDVKITSLSVSADGTLSMSGTTASYRSVADLLVALKSWDTLESVDLLSTATNITSTKLETTFSLSAKIDKTKQKAATTSVSSTTDINGLTPNNSTSDTSTLNGGSNAKI
jgi:Tfp pilus assembly protein PilN